MSRIVYVAGRYRPYREAAVHVEDRGFQFADAVYEVCQVAAGRLVDERRHLDRLERSLGEIGMSMPMSRAALRLVLYETLRRNRVRNGSLYLQVSRGAAAREFVFPGPDVRPTVVVIARAGAPEGIERRAEQGISVVTAPDLRWGRCDIKTVMLLPSCLAKSSAAAKGAREAWLVDADGFVTEGAASNAWIVDKAGRIVTRFVDHEILPGVTRATLLDQIAALGLPLDQRQFTVGEALTAREAFITSASNTVMPVTMIDGQFIGNGSPGPVTLALRRRFGEFAEAGSTLSANTPIDHCAR